MAARGYKCVLKIGVNTVAIAQDVEPELTADDQDITARQNLGFRDGQQGLCEIAFSPKLLWVPTDAAYKAIEASWFSKTNLSFSLLDESGYGWIGDCRCLSIRRVENEADAVTVTASFKSCGRFFQYSGSTTSPA